MPWMKFSLPAGSVLAALLAILCFSAPGEPPADQRALPGAGRDAPLHAGSPDAPRWLEEDGRPSGLAQQALQLLQNAAQEGLEPADYALGPAWEARLGQALLRYARDLHDGRVDPRKLDFRWPDGGPPFDAAAWLNEAVQHGELRVAAERLAPPAPYPALREQLAVYRALAAGDSVPALPPAPRQLQPGERWDGLPALRQRLQAFGDLPAAAATTPDPRRYDPALVGAVQAFQRRHGLQDDGVIGPATQAALRVPPAQRAQQIVLAMERLRWLPDVPAPRTLAINIPTFRLQALEGGSATGPAMDVIVGAALDTRTPAMLESMRYIVFRPYWNVPRSIVQKEILPQWADDPAYLDHQAMEIVQGPGDDAKVLGTGSELRAGLEAGTLRLRQRPGPKNALGLVKFIFPNDAAVYLHGTPEPQLFERTRRDLSHGCVRVEDPVTLATWLLRDVPGWDRVQVEAAMAGGNNHRVELPQPVPVLLAYLTAVVSPGDPRPHFAADLYGHDRRLERALKQRSRALSGHP